MIILLYNICKKKFNFHFNVSNSKKIQVIGQLQLPYKYIYTSPTYISRSNAKIHKSIWKKYEYHLIFPYHHETWNRSISIQIISLLIIGLARNLILSGWIDRFHQLFIDNALRNTHQLEFYDRFHQDTSRYAHVQIVSRDFG